MFDSPITMSCMGWKQTSMLIDSKRVAAMVGCAAVVLMGILSVVWNDLGDHSTGIVAGSGAGSSGGGYVPPSVSGMTVGATNTPTSPATTPAVAKAKPPLG